MKLFSALVCSITGHNWQRLNGYPVRGWKSLPYPDSYCSRCLIKGEDWLR
jgi:hypothetical protein